MESDRAPGPEIFQQIVLMEAIERRLNARIDNFHLQLNEGRSVVENLRAIRWTRELVRRGRRGCFILVRRGGRRSRKLARRGRRASRVTGGRCRIGGWALVRGGGIGSLELVRIDRREHQELHRANREGSMALVRRRSRELERVVRRERRELERIDRRVLLDILRMDEPRQTERDEEELESGQRWTKSACYKRIKKLLLKWKRGGRFNAVRRRNN
ncbi:uncharacterized protein LOC109604300 [Aethina tumida]|uniref:uncharacterized protein LOC109604300 n=1 Tax=Aethina tumida TaxID=116153 RepID=UPI002149107F|nr:uncharacterized protein LOC109604300 [Aethina tumida]